MIADGSVSRLSGRLLLSKSSGAKAELEICTRPVQKELAYWCRILTDVTKTKLFHPWCIELESVLYELDGTLREGREQFTD